MTKKELIEMLSNIPDDSNIEIENISDGVFGRTLQYNNINGFYKLSNGSYVLSNKYVQPRGIIK